MTDLLVFGPKGPIENTLRFADEPARHKVLDIVGDLSLLGQDLRGHVVAYRSGHPLNVELVRVLQRNWPSSSQGKPGPHDQSRKRMRRIFLLAQSRKRKRRIFLLAQSRKRKRRIFLTTETQRHRGRLRVSTRFLCVSVPLWFNLIGIPFHENAA